MSNDNDEDKLYSKKTALNRHDDLLAGTTLAAASALSLMLIVKPVPVVAQTATTGNVVVPTERTVLPIPQPQYPHSTVFNARNATPPPRFEVKAPANAPNILIVLIDDMGFGQSSAFGPDSHADCGATCQRRASLQRVSHHGVMFADARGTAHGAQSSCK